jgi:hypothetical protein
MWKANGKTTTASFFWIVSFQKQRYHVCDVLGYRRGYSHLKEAVDLSSDRLLIMMIMIGDV